MKRFFKIAEGKLRADRTDFIFPITMYLMKKNGTFANLMPKYFDREVELFVRLKK